jgi:hypothetical protein
MPFVALLFVIFSNEDRKCRGGWRLVDSQLAIVLHLFLFPMPYYGSRLKASTLPGTETLSLEALSDEENNPHLLSLPKLIARLVREFGAKWALENVNEHSFPENGAKTTLSQRGTQFHRFLVLSLHLTSNEFIPCGTFSVFNLP